MVAALAGVAFLAVPGSPGHRSLHEGLDIQGGLEVVLQAKPLKGQQLTSSMMDDSVSIIRNRVDGLGVSEPVITKQGTNQIVVELPAIHNATQAAQVIGQTAQLELYDLTPSLYGPSIDAQQDAVPHTSLFDLLTLVQTGQKGAPSAYYLFNSRTKQLVAGPEQSVAALKRDPVVIDAQAAEGEDRHRQDRPRQEREDDNACRQAGQDDRRLPDRLPGADRPEPDGRHLV